ncbi:hypothetical protein BH23GEM9_BH23GEM9_17120 [soil metagenome]
MSRNVFDDSRDEELGRALDDAMPRPPVDDVDWSSLHARITSAAQPLLQQGITLPSLHAAGPAWWQPLAGWSHRGIPLAAAATVLLLIGTAALGTATGRQTAAADDAMAFLTVEEELANGVEYGARSLLAGVGMDAMIDVALFDDGEDW